MPEISKKKLERFRSELYNNIVSYDFRDKLTAHYNYCIEFLNRTQRIFKYNGLPETLPAEFIETYLQVNGFTCITPVNGDLYGFFGGLGGCNESPYYQPTFCIINNSALNFNKEVRHGKDGVIIRNDLHFHGIIDIISRYATALLENDISLDMCSKNMRSVIMIAAQNDDMKTAADKFISDVAAGKLSAIADPNFMRQIQVFPMSGNQANSIIDLIEYHQYLKAGLFNEIGLNANYNMKRERLSESEIGLNDSALIPLIDEMLECRKRGFDMVNKMFGTNITVELSPLWAETVKTAETPIETQEQTENEPEKEGEKENENPE